MRIRWREGTTERAYVELWIRTRAALIPLVEYLEAVIDALGFDAGARHGERPGTDEGPWT